MNKICFTAIFKQSALKALLWLKIVKSYIKINIFLKAFIRI